MGDKGFDPGDLVRIRATDEELKALDDDGDGEVEAIVVTGEDEDGLFSVASVSSGSRRFSGHVLRARVAQLEGVAGVQLPGFADALIVNREPVLDPLKLTLLEEAQEVNIQVDESAFTELDNYTRHTGVNLLPDDKLRLVVEGMFARALESVEPGGRVGAGDIRNVLMHLCDDPFGVCSGAAARILEGSDHDLDFD